MQSLGLGIQILFYIRRIMVLSAIRNTRDFRPDKTTVLYCPFSQAPQSLTNHPANGCQAHDLAYPKNIR